jgi:hypothetical protein
MPSKMERFTQRARRVLSLAQESAEQFDHSYIGTEHLLLGLVRESDGVAGEVLHNLGIGQQWLETLIKEMERSQTILPNTQLDLSPATKQVLELAVDEARRMGHHYIGTEHLLLGLVRQSEGSAIVILKHLSISPEEVRRQVHKVLQESPAVPQTSAQPAARFTGSPITRSFSLTSQESNSAKIIETAILKILEMIAVGNLNMEQATELLTALQPEIFLMPGDQARLAALFQNAPENRRLRLIVTNKETGALQLEMNVPLSNVLKAMDAVVRALINKQTGQLWLDQSDAQNKIEIRIDEDKA